MEYTHSKELETAVLSGVAPSMRYDGSESIEAWQEKSRAKLRELLGEYENCADEMKIEYDRTEEDYREIRFLHQTEPGYFVPCHLLVPKKTPYEKPPLMICLQGHSTGMHISLGRPKFDGDAENISHGDRDFAVQCIARGVCAVTVEQRCFGERGGKPRPDCHAASMTALLSGRTVIGGRVHDISRTVDVCLKYFAEYFDEKEIWCGGNSGGGTATFYAAALDKRITRAMPSCALCTFAGSIGSLNHCECNYVPGIAKYFDMAELGGLIAPRRLVAVSGLTDGIFPIDGAKHEFDIIKNVYYNAFGKENEAVHVIGPEGHRFYAALAWDKILK